MGYKVVILLLGKLYEQYKNAIKWEEAKGNIEVLAIGVPDPYAFKLDDWIMTDIDHALSLEFDYLIISQTIGETVEAAKTFGKIGTSPERVLSIEVFGAICFDFAEYVKLHHKKVSIIASNCWGGFTYHALKIPFYSPFINMFLEDDDYLRLVSDLDGYLGQPLKQDVSEKAMQYDYPIGLLGDVRLHLNHYQNFAGAKIQWERRLARLNREQLFLMMYTCREDIACAFSRLPYPRKVVFTPKDFGVDCQINLERFLPLIDYNLGDFFKTVNSVSSGALQFYDPIRLLNGEKYFYRTQDDGKLDQEKMNEKKVSVIVPCYNSGQWIERCIGSLFGQTMKHEEIEIVLVDDCSTDDTWEVLCSLEKTYPSDSMIIIRSEAHGCPGGARNLALSYASAPYVAMVDSDDWVEPDFLEKMYGAAVTHDCDIVCCNAYRDYGDGRMFSMEYHNQSRLITIEDLEKRKEVLLQGCLKGRMLARKQYLLDNRIFYPDRIVYEDICWNALNYCYMKRMYVMPDFLYHYFVNPDSVVMKQEQDYSRDMFTTNYIKWDELVDRGFYELMPKEIEFDMLISYYLMILKMYKTRFQTIPTDGFYEMQTFIKEHMPDYQRNPYIDTWLSEGQRELLNFIEKPMQENELQILHNILEKMTDI